MDTVQPRHTRTTILTSRTPTCRHLLLWRVTYRIPRTTATLPLKDVEEAEPVADLVRGATTLIVIGNGAAGDGICEDVAAVFLEDAAGFVGAGRGGEVANAEETPAEVGEKVDIQIGVIAFAEGCSWLAVLACEIICGLAVCRCLKVLCVRYGLSGWQYVPGFIVLS